MSDPWQDLTPDGEAGGERVEVEDAGAGQFLGDVRQVTGSGESKLVLKVQNQHGDQPPPLLRHLPPHCGDLHEEAPERPLRDQLDG